ncbi:MAG: 30S ribosomal protein S7 [Planctomycetaceae bacterium]|nr:30S ribosomal protein S7 [Planctomycetota bacterium]MCQ3950935.1 30S ribosomal protein S7 [Planctomycetota bacterium]NUO15090.1 30S ribosomal protein S7 [Planctomycetaceae bacterium]GIK53607.1 MAG: 30S ribosomal protein S7 [Planctomycetota bacterium]
MPRNYKSTERFLTADPVYSNKLLSKFINCIMKEGKKSVAQRIVYSALDQLKKRVPDKDPLEVFNEALNNCRPVVEVRSKRVGGATYQVPMEVSKKRQQALAIRWLINAATGRKGKPMHERLAEELSDAYKREGAAVKKREETHRMADANKAFAHFAW